MTFHEELHAIANLQLELGHLQRRLIERVRVETDITDRDPERLREYIEAYRLQWADVRNAFDALSRD